MLEAPGIEAQSKAGGGESWENSSDGYHGSVADLQRHVQHGSTSARESDELGGLADEIGMERLHKDLGYDRGLGDSIFPGYGSITEAKAHDQGGEGQGKGG